MTGIQIDLFTVALMVILAFICGYSSGHKYGRNEVRRSITDIASVMSKMTDEQKTKTEQDYRNFKHYLNEWMNPDKEQHKDD